MRSITLILILLCNFCTFADSREDLLIIKKLFLGINKIKMENLENCCMVKYISGMEQKYYKILYIKDKNIYQSKPFKYGSFFNPADDSEGEILYQDFVMEKLVISAKKVTKIDKDSKSSNIKIELVENLSNKQSR